MSSELINDSIADEANQSHYSHLTAYGGQGKSTASHCECDTSTYDLVKNVSIYNGCSYSDEIAVLSIGASNCPILTDQAIRECSLWDVRTGKPVWTVDGFLKSVQRILTPQGSSEQPRDIWFRKARTTMHWVARNTEVTQAIVDCVSKADLSTANFYVLGKDGERDSEIYFAVSRSKKGGFAKIIVSYVPSKFLKDGIPMDGRCYVNNEHNSQIISTFRTIRLREPICTTLVKCKNQIARLVDEKLFAFPLIFTCVQDALDDETLRRLADDAVTYLRTMEGLNWLCEIFQKLANACDFGKRPSLKYFQAILCLYSFATNVPIQDFDEVLFDEKRLIVVLESLLKTSRVNSLTGATRKYDVKPKPTEQMTLDEAIDAIADKYRIEEDNSSTKIQKVWERCIPSTTLKISQYLGDLERAYALREKYAANIDVSMDLDGKIMTTTNDKSYTYITPDGSLAEIPVNPMWRAFGVHGAMIYDSLTSLMHADSGPAMSGGANGGVVQIMANTTSSMTQYIIAPVAKDGSDSLAGIDTDAVAYGRLIMARDRRELGILNPAGRVHPISWVTTRVTGRQGIYPQAIPAYVSVNLKRKRGGRRVSVPILITTGVGTNGWSRSILGIDDELNQKVHVCFKVYCKELKIFHQQQEITLKFGSLLDSYYMDIKTWKKIFATKFFTITSPRTRDKDELYYHLRHLRAAFRTYLTKSMKDPLLQKHTSDLTPADLNIDQLSYEFRSVTTTKQIYSIDSSALKAFLKSQTDGILSGDHVSDLALFTMEVE